MSDYSNAQEYRVRDLVREFFPHIQGIERVPLSGAANLCKGDIGDVDGRLPMFIDHKSSRGRNSITINRDDIEKVVVQGKRKRYQLLTFSFFKDREMYAVIPLKDALELISNTM